jgi:hypothetical protein
MRWPDNVHQFGGKIRWMPVIDMPVPEVRGPEAQLWRCGYCHTEIAVVWAVGVGGRISPPEITSHWAGECPYYYQLPPGNKERMKR